MNQQECTARRQTSDGPKELEMPGDEELLGDAPTQKRSAVELPTGLLAAWRRIPEVIKSNPHTEPKFAGKILRAEFNRAPIIA
jgi:hypothetical protein